ncbi:MAG: restriction endonuclease [Deltaproteobacteria bacterium CG12_big_fil_rev_8_21_14_0_65_43_10]|nr:MAG: hypothetical protein AUK23_10655 [Deltaproteobacteria bacterium CG2_30_43_15]PIQ45999.1 MAG: restriction endonuclease [Deltaproteobacteria bacterium CG12_big_fil_rev_8_21_14_0_65_43_10]PIU85854.1 MAG: restriction endonuclease subunit S [Deltaproteobacteria bacterium CG06_land_8_20_14_3_00_44_19]PIX23741.1 MAG: restriction endonuclease subunit S [Deltaproteobacteria bacterium CG_4_8_14_3_um_filter_43_13]PIZ20780.1 MAG: restriction endonuclease subunit S [Deltaproteobacteria bacterium CG_
MNLNKIKFNKFVTLQRGFDLPVSEMKDGEIPVLGSTGIIGYHNKAKVNPPGVITGRSGTIGVIQYVDKPYWPHNTSLWVKDFKSNHPKFVYFKMKTLNFERFNGGASVPTLNRNNLDNIIVQVPDIPTQERISSILSVYDDLIDTNRQRIQLLEESARLLFREWFVYFRFPGHEKVKIVDGVPEGWGKINFMDIISAIESGGRPKGGAIGDGVPSIGAENVNGIGNYNYSNEKYVPEEYYQKMNKGKVISKDVLLYKDGANIGRTTIVGYGFPHNKCCVNEHVFILRTKNNIQNWLYFFLSQDFIQQAIANLNSNSAQPGISQDKLSSLKIIFPKQGIVRLFDDVAESTVKQIFMLSIQNQKLAQARDLLLPRLMIGTIEV